MKPTKPPEYIETILAKFADTPRTEEAFYLEYCRLTLADLQNLAAWYHDDDWWRVFKRICAAWRLCRPPRPSTRCPSRRC